MTSLQVYSSTNLVYVQSTQVIRDIMMKTTLVIGTTEFVQKNSGKTKE